MPLVLGHEGSGEVVEVGAGVRDIKVGDPIVFNFRPLVVYAVIALVANLNCV